MNEIIVISRTIWLRWLYLPAAILLLIGGSAKLITWQEGSNAEVLNLPNWYQLAISFGELALGFWLLSRKWFALSRVIVALVYLTFLIFTILIALQGQSTCACLGHLTPANPWYMVAFDAVCLACLLLCFAAPTDGDKENGSIMGASWVCSFAMAIVLISGIVYGPERATAAVQGKKVIAIPQRIYIGTGINGKNLKVDVEIANIGDQPVRLHGGTSDCTCIATAGMPVTVEPYQTIRLPLYVQFRGSPGTFQHRLVLYTDHEQNPTVTATITGSILSE